LLILLVKTLAICPITRVLFASHGSKLNAYQVEKDGKLTLLKCLPRGRVIGYLKVEGKSLIAAYKKRQGEKQELAFSFHKEATLLDIADEFIDSGSKADASLKRFFDLDPSIQNCIYECMGEVLMENDPHYLTYWWSGEEVFYEKMEEYQKTRDPETGRLLKLAFKKAHIKLLKKEKSESAVGEAPWSAFDEAALYRSCCIF
jgi:hypothetical protein